MSLRELFATNSSKEIEGVRIAFSDDPKAEAFYLSRMSKSNKQYTKELDRQLKPLQKLMEMKQLPREKSDSVMMNVFIATVLKGWDNVKLSDIEDEAEAGALAPFTPENAKKLFTNLPDLYDALYSAANDAANFKDAVAEAKAKN